MRKSNADLLFEIGRLYAEQGNFSGAVGPFTEAQSEYLTASESDGYLKCLNQLFQIYAEIYDDTSIRVAKERLHDLIVTGQIESTTRSFYTLALAARLEEQHKQSLDYLVRAFAAAIEADDNEGICYALWGRAEVYFHQQQFGAALKEVRNLQVVLQVLDIPDLKLASQILHGKILCAQGQAREALEIYWDAFELLKIQKSFLQQVKLLVAVGLAFKKLGDKLHARQYLWFAQCVADPSNLKMQAEVIQHEMVELGPREETAFDLIVDSSAHTVIEKRKGRIDFRNQHILLDLLKIFAKKPGEIHSKAALVQQIWRQPYDPRIHDNKLYVNIKRLRHLLEPDDSNPRYIFRGKQGYYLNRNTKILIDEESRA